MEPGHNIIEWRRNRGGGVNLTVGAITKVYGLEWETCRSLGAPNREECKTSSKTDFVFAFVFSEFADVMVFGVLYSFHGSGFTMPSWCTLRSSELGAHTFNFFRDPTENDCKHSIPTLALSFFF